MAIPSAPAASPAMMAGRGSPNPMPAGLSALLKPDSTPRGMPSGSIQQIMNTARKMSDSQLADVLAGRSIDIPQYVAMTEAMGRKKLRTAMQGAQAQAQMQQPSVKDKLLAEEAVSPMMGQMPMMAAEGGLASLPAPNMDSVDMADGGIIAFNGEDNRQLVTQEDLDRLITRGQRPLTKEEKEKLESTPNLLKDLGVSQRTIAARGTTAPRASTAQDIINFTGEGYGPYPVIPAAASAAAPAAAPPAAGVGTPPAAAPTNISLGGFKSYMDAIKANQEDYYKALAGLGAKQREGLAQLRSQGGGEALMNLAQGLLSRRGLAAGISAGLPGVIQSAAASRKEQRGVENLANEYDMNLAKARAADARGNTEAALKFMEMADTAKYRMAALNKPGETVQLLNALGDPKMMERYQAMQLAKKPTELVSREKALEQFNKLTKSKQKEYGDFENYFRSVNNQGLYATLPGQGADVIGTIK